MSAASESYSTVTAEEMRLIYVKSVEDLVTQQYNELIRLLTANAKLGAPSAAMVIQSDAVAARIKTKAESAGYHVKFDHKSLSIGFQPEATGNDDRDIIDGSRRRRRNVRSRSPDRNRTDGRRRRSRSRSRSPPYPAVDTSKKDKHKEVTIVGIKSKIDKDDGYTMIVQRQGNNGMKIVYVANREITNKQRKTLELADGIETAQGSLLKEGRGGSKSHDAYNRLMDLLHGEVLVDALGETSRLLPQWTVLNELPARCLVTSRCAIADLWN